MRFSKKSLGSISISESYYDPPGLLGTRMDQMKNREVDLETNPGRRRRRKKKRKRRLRGDRRTPNSRVLSAVN